MRTEQQLSHTGRFDMSRLKVLVVLAMVILLALPTIAFGATGPTATIGIKGMRDYTKAYGVLTIVNQQRAAVGLPALSMNAGLMDAAMKRAEESRIKFSHYRPNGDVCFTISSDAGLGGENIAAGSTTAAAVMTNWMNSPGHRSNILDASYKSIGIGCFDCEGTIIWVQLFSSLPSSAAPQPVNVTAVAPIEVLTSSLILSGPASLSLKSGATTEVVLRGKTAEIFGSSPIIEKEFLDYTSANPSVVSFTSPAKVTGGTAGSTTVTVSVKGAPAAALSIPVTVSDAYRIVTFDSQGGSAVAAKSVATGTAIGTLPTTTKKGHTFKGWFTAPSGGTKVTTAYKPPANVTLYAQWTVNKYTIKYYNGTTLLKSVTAKYGSALNSGSYAPAKTGYNFSGWYTAASGGTKVETVTKNQSVYARYKIKYYTVKFYNGTELIATKSIKYKGAPIAAPTKTGYKFVGWYTAATGGTKVTSITKNQSLYARYSIKSYTVTYYNGSTLLKKVIVKYNSVLMTGPAKTGYTFVGWFDAKAGGTQYTKVPAKNITLYARYRAPIPVYCHDGSHPITHQEPVYETQPIYENQPIYEWQSYAQCNTCGEIDFGSWAAHVTANPSCTNGYTTGQRQVQVGTQQVQVGTQQVQVGTTTVVDCATQRIVGYK